VIQGLSFSYHTDSVYISILNQCSNKKLSRKLRTKKKAKKPRYIFIPLDSPFISYPAFLCLLVACIVFFCSGPVISSSGRDPSIHQGSPSFASKQATKPPPQQAPSSDRRRRDYQCIEPPEPQQLSVYLYQLGKLSVRSYCCIVYYLYLFLFSSLTKKIEGGPIILGILLLLTSGKGLSAAQRKATNANSSIYLHPQLSPYRSWPLFLQCAPPSTHPSARPSARLFPHTTYYLTLSPSPYGPDLNLNLT
jgi:hypothetical protein